MFETNAIGMIHQVLIVDGLKLPNQLPKNINANTLMATALYPDAEYRLWGGQSLREFLSREFGDEVLWAFDTLAPYSYKCDLARFCLLFHFGGLYLDLAVRLVHPWLIPKDLRYCSIHRDVSRNAKLDGNTNQFTVVQAGAI